MPVTLNASTSSGLVTSADTSGEIQLQNNGTTRLTVNASGVTIPTLTATTVSGTIVQGTAVASTSGTAIDFTGIPSWAKKITVNFSGVSLSGTDGICVQLGDSGGIETTGYASVASDSSGGTSTTTTALLCSVSAGGANASSVSSGSCTITNLTGNTWVSTATIGSAVVSIYASYCSGSKTLSDVLTQIRVTRTGTNTFDAGTINIQYEG
mgnify:CR=1 FL=1